jgi:hypothetical protein
MKNPNLGKDGGVDDSKSLCTINLELAVYDSVLLARTDRAAAEAW